MIIIPKNWINEPDENGNGLLEAQIEKGEVDFPIPIETHNVSAADVTLGAKQDFGFVVEGASEIQIYADEDDYYRKNPTGFAANSYVPAGLFSPDNDENYVKSARAIMNGKIVKTYDVPTEFGFEADDVLFTMNCLGYEFDGVLFGGAAKFPALSVGNYVSGIFWIQGWPLTDAD